jgi:hypothetical protein
METHKSGWQQALKDILIRVVQNLPWGSVVLKILQELAGRFFQSEVSGLYEVLEYESTLELKDAQGKRAVFSKRQKVRYLQDSIIAYQDQAWGDGEILLGYHCSPGVPVDRYRLGHKTIILISLRQVKPSNSQDEFYIQWGIRNGFLKPEEQWETEISHSTRRLKMTLIFPKGRGPEQLSIIEASTQLSRPLMADGLREMPDGRWQASWEVLKPKQYERYILKWAW